MVVRPLRLAQVDPQMHSADVCLDQKLMYIQKRETSGCFFEYVSDVTIQR